MKHKVGRGEVTGTKAKRLAAKWLAACRYQSALGAKGIFVPIDEFATICGSDLTQAPDRKVVLATARKKKAGKE